MIPSMEAEPDRRTDAGQPPWPLSELDTSPAATRRRGLRLFHVVLLILGGGALWVATSFLVAAIVFGVVFALLARGHIAELAASVDRLGGELTETYARIEEANRGIEEAKRKAAETDSERSGQGS
jgi:hypothetical protein